MTTTVVEKFGSLSATGVAKEATFGTAVTPTGSVPMTGNGLELDPGLFWPKVMMGQRDLNIFGLYGQFKNAGSVTAPFFPSNAITLLVGAIGYDGGNSLVASSQAGSGQGITGSTPTNSTTLTAAITTVGATTFSIASATGYVTNGMIQIDVNLPGTPTTAEVRKISNIVGTTITVDSALNFTHLNGATVSVVQAPFTHTVQQANTLPSFTVEKELGLGQTGGESLQFVGSRINKYEITCTNSNTEVGQSIDFMSKLSQVLASSSAVSVVNENPYVFAEASLTLGGLSVLQAENVTFTIQNGLKDTYTLNGSRNLQFLSPVTRALSAKMDVVFHNFDDTNWGYWSQMQSMTNMNTFSFVLTHPASGGTITFSCPYTRIAKYQDSVKMEDIVTTTLNLDFGLNLSTLQTVNVTIVNSQYLPY